MMTINISRSQRIVRGSWSTGFYRSHILPQAPGGFRIFLEIPVRTKQASCGFSWKTVFSCLLLRVSIENRSLHAVLQYSLVRFGSRVRLPCSVPEARDGSVGRATALSGVRAELLQARMSHSPTLNWSSNPKLFDCWLNLFTCNPSCLEARESRRRAKGGKPFVNMAYT